MSPYDEVYARLERIKQLLIESAANPSGTQEDMAC